MVLKEVTRLWVSPDPDMNRADIDGLVKSHMLAQEAQSDFLSGALTLEEYLHLLSLHEINTTAYMHSMENSLERRGLFV
jgi:hypothetical protein